MSSAIIKDWRALPESREKYHLYLASRDWAVHKEAVRKRSGGICERCHHNEATQVHHQTYERKYNERLEDLLHLCGNCHEFISGKTKVDPWLSVPVELFGMRIGAVYLAGKITGTSWRDQIAPGWSHERHLPTEEIIEDGDWHTIRDAVPIPDGRTLDLTGPWWRSPFPENGSGGHTTVASTVGEHAFGVRLSHDELSYDNSIEYRVDRNLLTKSVWGAILRAELVFAWIDSDDCYGTLAEIGMASGMHTCLYKPIVVASPQRDPLSRDELWLAKSMANLQVHAPTPAEAWHKLWTENKAW